ncbi:type II secretion system major pseudopilin GspG [Marinomonas balearica]|uniref:Type II secretion system core protein G n=1 Tax=Marinomonas balearica TaxID=491947 RepID=A0A4R6M9R5_9GAMM|nr:general secretion pathway protein G [Marinomonas balearica]
MFRFTRNKQTHTANEYADTNEFESNNTMNSLKSTTAITPARHPRNKQSKRGFTLLELMVVLVILGALIGLIAPNILGRADEAKVTVAKTQMRDVVNALNLYKLDNGNFPSTAQGLEALVSKPSGFPEARNWKSGGYLSKLPKDPWSNDFVYVSPGSTGDYDLISLGSDGREGGDDDAEDLSSSDL